MSSLEEGDEVSISEDEPVGLDSCKFDGPLLVRIHSQEDFTGMSNPYDKKQYYDKKCDMNRILFDHGNYKYRRIFRESDPNIICSGVSVRKIQLSSVKQKTSSPQVGDANNLLGEELDTSPIVLPVDQVENRESSACCKHFSKYKETPMKNKERLVSPYSTLKSSALQKCRRHFMSPVSSSRKFPRKKISLGTVDKNFSHVKYSSQLNKTRDASVILNDSESTPFYKCTGLDGASCSSAVTSRHCQDHSKSVSHKEHFTYLYAHDSVQNCSSSTDDDDDSYGRSSPNSGRSFSSTLCSSSSSLQYSVDSDDSLIQKQKGSQRPNYRRYNRSSLSICDGSFKKNYQCPYNVKEIMAFQTGTFIDSHCHLDFLFDRLHYHGSFEAYQRKCRVEDEDPFPPSFEGCVAVFCNPETFSKVYSWESHLNNSNVWAAFGCHPHFSDKFSPREEMNLRSALSHKKVVALGEIGLDYSGKNNHSEELQQEVFRRQLSIALEMKLPLVIHCRDADGDCFSIMKEVVPQDYRIHRHCFTGTWMEADKWLSHFSKLYIGFTPLIANSNGKDLHYAVRKIPLENLLLETDSPFFRPKVLPFSSGFSHPGHAIHVAAQIAHLKQMSLGAVMRQLRKNTKQMYGI